MPRPIAVYPSDPLDQWTTRVVAGFPTLTTPQARGLALYSFGMVSAGAGGLSRVAEHLAALLGQAHETVRKRLRDFYLSADAKSGRRRRDFDPADCFAPLLGWILSDWGDGQLALAIDATSLGDRMTVLCVSVLYRSCAVPVAWAVLPGNRPEAWNPHWIRLLKRLRERVDPSRRVVVLSDRGLESSELFRAIVELGWHPLMRAKDRGCFRPEGWTEWRRLGGFTTEVGSRYQARGSAYKEKDARLECTLLAWWGEGHDDPWLILTDLPPQAADAAWYAMRAWIEHSFKKTKSDGWGWNRTRMTDPKRAARLWLVMALATLWMLEVGGAKIEGLPRVPATRTRRISVFLHGLATVRAALCDGVAAFGRFHPQPWPGPPRDARPPPVASTKIDVYP